MSTLPWLTIRRPQMDRKRPRFTPGPYHVAGSGPKLRSLKSAGGRSIAYVLFSERRASECEGTARLLAAAPDLLCELRTYVNDCGCGRKKLGCERCLTARNAIAKAEGK